MPTVTLHKNCKLTPDSANAIHNGTVSFAFNTTGTLNLNPSSFFGQGSISSSGDLTVQAGANSSCTITVASGTCTPSTGEDSAVGDSDSCVITVTSEDLGAGGGKKY